MVGLPVLFTLTCLVFMGTVQSHNHNDDDLLVDDLSALYEPMAVKRNIYNRIRHRKFNRRVLKRGPETLWELD
ncbi:uncharacterized protein DC041_0003421 [Schistosoma bovis]|uniref:Uncharacterized protein n=1 Tax=Schistosoma bovis TaxID=6184 RepID=A0A430Q5S2_SCHBO|nr:uncharacterized protein DC041_0003421 [Schistosoma bovis]CAH8649835.1 unnamed protein product [Schistosoma curassoni]